jgi:hypothetical protein
MKALRLLPFLFAMSCEDDGGGTYVQFNHTDDSLEIVIGDELTEDQTAAKTIDLTSSTGDNVIGQATVDPGGGPCGTEHTIIVVVSDEYEDQVDRVTVVTDSAERGTDEYDLDQDSADEGYYKLSLQSTGEPGEDRKDTLTFKVYELVADSG